MGKKTLLTVDQVCVILEACSKSGVTVLKFGELHVEFEASKPVPIVETILPSPPAAEIAALQQKIERSSMADQEDRARADQLEFMLIEDPVEAERLRISGEVSEDDDEFDEEA